jgi:hypothetical protein
MPVLCSFFASGSRALIALLSVSALFFAAYAVGLHDTMMQVISAGYALALGVCAWRQVQVRHARREEHSVREVA